MAQPFVHHAFGGIEEMADFPVLIGVDGGVGVDAISAEQIVDELAVSFGNLGFQHVGGDGMRVPVDHILGHGDVETIGLAIDMGVDPV